MPVSKNDTVSVPGDIGNKSQVVQWEQSFNHKSEEYVVSEYTVINKDGESQNAGLIYVAKNKLEEFKSKATKGDKLTLKVDESFQYGQKKGGEDRFLVYHDKGNKMYQHRFVESTVAKWGNAAAGFALDKGYKQMNQVGDVLKHFVGDYLKNF